MIAVILAAALSCGANATQMELNVCSDAQARREDALERRAFAATLEQYSSDEDRALLHHAERAWHSYRAAQCAFESQLAAGGSIQPLVDNNCMASLTHERTTTLRWFAPRSTSTPLVPSAASMQEQQHVYGTLEVRLSPGERRMLAQSENRWREYRAAVCAPAPPDCATRLTRLRAQTLKSSWLGEPFW